VRRVCLNCQRHFESRKAAEYCSGRCRAAASRRRKQQDLTAALDEAERTLRKLRLIVLRGGDFAGEGP